MKSIAITLCILLLVACTDYDLVLTEYTQGNDNAKDLLVLGFNRRLSSAISTPLIKAALAGDEEAKDIIYAQMQMLRGLPSSSHTHVTPVYIAPARR